MTTQRAPVELAPLKAQVTDLTVIASPEAYRQAGELLADVQKARRKVTQWYADIRKPFNDALKETRRHEMNQMADLVALEQSLTTAMRRWEQAEEEQKRAEQEAALEAAMQAAVTQRALRLQTLADAAEEATPALRAELEARALRIAEQPVMPLVAVTPDSVPKVEGLHTRETWSAVVNDVRSLRLAAGAASLRRLLAEMRTVSDLPLDHPVRQRWEAIDEFLVNVLHTRGVADVPDTVLTPDMTVLNEMARSLRSALAVPGVTAVKKSTYVSR
jgi:hypothetical protein